MALVKYISKYREAVKVNSARGISTDRPVKKGSDHDIDKAAREHESWQSGYYNNPEEQRMGNNDNYDTGNFEWFNDINDRTPSNNWDDGESLGSMIAHSQDTGW